MTLLLVFPPFTDPTQPSAVLPTLAAAVRELTTVHLWDANLDAWYHLLDLERQAAWLARVERRLARLERRTTLDERERGAYLALVRGALRGAAAAGSVGRALQVLRSEAFFSASDYTFAIRALEGALDLVAAAHHPSCLEWGRFWPACSFESSREIVREAGRPATNPFLQFSQEAFVPRLRSLAPDIVGISVNYVDQIVPALTLSPPTARGVFQRLSSCLEDRS